jgi:hypothetical protein
MARGRYWLGEQEDQQQNRWVCPNALIAEGFVVMLRKANTKGRFERKNFVILHPFVE